jgi:Type II CAAX prenyl endopeptidase Rce1-like
MGVLNNLKDNSFTKNIFVSTHNFFQPQFECYLADSKSEIKKAQRLRYKIFCNERNGTSIFNLSSFKRYKHLFDNKITLVLVNAFLFSFAHVIFMNPIVLIFTFFGGIIFAYIYSTTNSLVKVSLEHGLFGDIVFSSGLGVYFYHLTAIQH